MVDEESSSGKTSFGRNGNERRQDNELRDLRLAVNENRTIMENNRAANEEYHAALATTAETNYRHLAEKIDSLKDTVGDLRGDVKGSKWVVNVVRIVVVGFIVSLGWVLVRSEERINTLEIWSSAHNTSSEQYKAAIKENKEDIDELNKDHHLFGKPTLSPGKKK